MPVANQGPAKATKFRRPRVDADKKVGDAKTRFGKNDKIYASVSTVGSAPSVTLKAVWNFKGEKGDVLVAEKEMTIAPTGRASTAFDVEKASGWPFGAYSVEIFANGVATAKTEFIVSL